jgi:hypothetical protein
VARAVHCDRSVRELGGGRRRRLRRRLNAWASLPSTYGCALALGGLSTGPLHDGHRARCGYRCDDEAATPDSDNARPRLRLKRSRRSRGSSHRIAAAAPSPSAVLCDHGRGCSF